MITSAHLLSLKSTHNPVYLGNWEKSSQHFSCRNDMWKVMVVKCMKHPQGTDVGVYCWQGVRQSIRLLTHHVHPWAQGKWIYIVAFVESLLWLWHRVNHVTCMNHTPKNPYKIHVGHYFFLLWKMKLKENNFPSVTELRNERSWVWIQI